MADKSTREQAYAWLRSRQATVEFGSFKTQDGKPGVKVIFGAHQAIGAEIEDAVDAVRSAARKHHEAEIAKI